MNIAKSYAAVSIQKCIVGVVHVFLLRVSRHVLLNLVDLGHNRDPNPGLVTNQSLHKWVLLS